MSDTNLAAQAVTGSDEPLTVDAGTDAIAELLTGPETEPQKEDGEEIQADEAQGTEGDKSEEESEAQADETEAEKDEDGQQEGYERGKFAALVS